MADEITRIRRDTRTRFANGCWNLDRYPDLTPLVAGSAVTVADFAGPGIIRMVHVTRHQPADLFARGIVLEIRFDDALEPAVLCPLADFFGDGCNGAAMDFSSLLIECAPWSYNAYFPMPFRRRAQVTLRNDTAQDTMSYCFVEAESLPAWDNTIGYFHAAYSRRAFRLSADTSQEFLRVNGAGHLVGRQFSVTTDEPLFGMALVLDRFHASLSHGDDGFISGDPQSWVHVFGSLDGPWFSAAGALSHSLVGDVTHGRQDHPGHRA